MISSSALAYSSLQMLNSTGRTIYYVFLVPNGSSSWGQDRLSGVWHDGDTLTLDVSNYRYWDLKIRFQDWTTCSWDSLDTREVYMLTLTRKNGGGYRAIFNH